MIEGPGAPASGGSAPSGGGDVGAVTAGSGGSAGSASTPAGPLQSFECDAQAPVDPGPSPLNQLSRRQYENTLRALFGTLPDLSEALGQDTASTTQLGLLQPDIDAVQVTAFQSAAETVAAWTVADAQRLQAVAPCADGSPPRQCAEDFVASFAAKAYRAKLSDEDVSRHLGVYDAGAKVSHAHGIELSLRAILQAPRFLYRVELGTDQKVSSTAVLLSPEEIAARLSYLVWDGPPDAALLDAASSGKLGTPEQVTAELTRMLEGEKGASFVRRFLATWTGISGVDRLVKDDELYPEWNAQGASLAAAERAQAEAFFDEVLTRQDGKLEALLTSQTVFVSSPLASFYDTTSKTADFTPMSDDRASGLLTLPALLSVLAKPAESSPIYRGKFVREQLLCQLLPAPPPNIPKPPDVMPGVSTRERLSQHETDTSCSGCHRLIDPIGFGFEHFDAIGRFRTRDGGAPIDARGTLTGTDQDGDFDGVSELGRKLASSTVVQECVARQWFRFATSRFEQQVDACALRGVMTAFTSSNFSLHALPQAIVESNAFLYRRPIEVSP